VDEESEGCCSKQLGVSGGGVLKNRFMWWILGQRERLMRAKECE